MILFLRELEILRLGILDASSGLRTDSRKNAENGIRGGLFLGLEIHDITNVQDFLGIGRIKY